MKPIAKNALFNVMYKVLNMLFPMIVSMYLTRVLGPVYLGKVTYAQNILSYFLAFASFGIPTYGIREIAKVAQNEYYKTKVFTELFILNAIFTIICSIIFYIGIFCKNLGYDRILYMCVGLTLCMNILNVDWFYSGIEEFVYIATRSFIIKILSVVAIFIFVKKKEDYIIYALITSIATTGNYILNAVNLRGKVAIRLGNINLKRHLKPVSILLITMLATDIYNQIDVTMLGIYYTVNEVAFYSCGIKLIRVITSVSIAIGSTILPRLSLMYKNGDALGFNKLFVRIFEVVIIIMLPLVIGLMLLSDELVITLYGDSFYPTAKIVFVLAPIILIISISYLVGSIVLTAINKEKCLMLATFMGVMSNIVLNKIFIPNSGMVGAAFASIIAELVVLIIHLFFSRKVLCIKGNGSYFRGVSLGAVGLVMIVYICKSCIKSFSICLIVSIILGGITYFLILAICKNEILMKVKDYIEIFTKNIK